MGFNVSSRLEQWWWSGPYGPDGLAHGLCRKRVGAWMPRTVGVLPPHRVRLIEPNACSPFIGVPLKRAPPSRGTRGGGR